jgi:hypothetical protein
MKHNLAFIQTNGTNLSVPYAGVTKYAETHFSNNQNSCLDYSNSFRHNQVVTP